ncbi:MAG: MauE/DoxX family redox-associated membrane protein [Pseudomonadota bacterium]
MAEALTVAAIAIKAFFSAYLLFAAAHKLVDQARFEQTLEDYQLLPPWALAPAAKLLPYIEVLIVLLIVWPATAATGLLLCTGLMTVYLLAMMSTLLRHIQLQDCGCGGIGAQATVGRWHLMRNAAFVLLSVVGATLSGFTQSISLAGVITGALVGGIFTLLCLSLEGLHSNDRILQGILSHE